MAVPILGPRPKPNHRDGLSPNRIVVEFADDHSIGGAKFDVSEVTPEQIAVACFHLERIATQLLNVASAMAAHNAAEVAAVAADPKLRAEA